MNLKPDEIIGDIGKVLTEEQKRTSVIIHSLNKIQEEDNYLPEERLRSLAEDLNVPLSVVYSTASFYKQFYFTPRGKNIVCVCVGTACHVRGSRAVVNQFEEAFKIKQGETTEDLSVTLETVGCVGCCGLAPVVVVNEEIIGELSSKKTENIISAINKKTDEKTGQ